MTRGSRTVPEKVPCGFFCVDTAQSFQKEPFLCWKRRICPKRAIRREKALRRCEMQGKSKL